MRLTGTVALITGGASGIGLGVARRFVAEGARIAVFDRSEKALAAVPATLGADVVTIAGDVRSYADNLRAVERTVHELGKLDTFVGNAGIFDNYMTLEELPADGGAAAFDELIGIDVKGYLLGAKAALPAVRAARGTMVFTASIAGLHPPYGGILYIPAKHAVVGLVKRLALELAPQIRVNGVAPGFVPTALAGTSALGQGSKDPGARPPADGFLLKVVPEVDDYTPLYAFLAAPESKTMTGQILLADGGMSLRRP